MIPALRVLRRVAFTVVAAYLVLSMTFLLIAVPPDPNEAYVMWVAQNQNKSPEEVQEIVEQYREKRNYDEALIDRYTNWMHNIVTLQWGDSYNRNVPVTSLLERRLPVTLGYVVPALALASVVGIAMGLYSAMRPGTVVDRFGTSLAYLAQSVPSFFLAVLALLYLVRELGWIPQAVYDPTAGVFATKNLVQLALPTAVLTVSLLANQLRYTRSEALSLKNEAFVLLKRSQGVSDLNLTRHVFRAGAVSIFSLFFVDVIQVLVLHVVVLEYVFNVPGFGMLTFEAIRARDLPVILGVTIVVVVVGMVGNLIQDLAYPLIDPRIGYDESGDNGA